MGKKQYANPMPIEQHYPAANREIGHALDTGCQAAFMVYQIQNGYLLYPQVRHSVSQPPLVYCKDIQDLTDQILSTQAQLRLNLQPAKTTF
jgi:hypothetical protein